jgi:hypothetical protein
MWIKVRIINNKKLNKLKMIRVMTQSIDNMLRYRENIFIFLVISISFLALSYVYFVHSTIVNVVERDKIIKDIREKSTSVSILESEYFAEKNKINIELAHAKGFENGEVSSYILKKSLTAFVVHNEL